MNILTIIIILQEKFPFSVYNLYNSLMLMKLSDVILMQYDTEFIRRDTF
jgi:hypothetical protein